MKKIVIIAIMLLSLLSCSDSILNITPTDRIADDAVWGDENLIKAYHTTLYNSCVAYDFTRHMLSKVTDEAYCSINFGVGLIPTGALTPDNVSSVTEANLYYWNTAYTSIRKIDVFLEKMKTITISDQPKLIAEAKFLRAYTYFLLIERFGGVPIVTQSYELGTDATFTSNTFDDCVSFIDKDLTDALATNSLPDKINASDASFGRATKDACLALRSRLYLYAASPLFDASGNGADKTKWQKAADAAKALIDRNAYSLNTNYRTMFAQLSGSANSELIFGRNFTVNNGHHVAMNNLGRRFGAYGGWWASNGPSQNLVDDYDMINGEPAFIWTNGVKTINPTSGYDPQHPYKNRDPRFEATIIHDSTAFRGVLMEMWVSSDGSKWGYDSYKQSGDNPRTNYELKKFMPEADVPISWNANETTPYPIFRLGEIYLNYAEAQFNLGNYDVCRQYINSIRARVGMPPIANTVQGEALKYRLYNERRIELAFEGHRYWDVRRWKIAADIENRPITCLDITKDLTTGIKTYTEVKLLDKKFAPQMYLLPISTDEIKKNKGTLLQSVTWR